MVGRGRSGRYAWRLSSRCAATRQRAEQNFMVERSAGLAQLRSARAAGASLWSDLDHRRDADGALVAPGILGAVVGAIVDVTPG